jgi:hypothetical protein
VAHRSGGLRVRRLGASAADFNNMLGDIVLTQENVTAGTSGLFRLFWDGKTLSAQPIPLAECFEVPLPIAARVAT